MDIDSNPVPHNEAPQVRVASYSNTTWQGSFRQRARAFWGTGFFGLAWGLGVGAVIATTMLATGTMAVASVPMLVIGFGATGGGIGLAVANSVGSAAGAVSSGMAEWESRFKQMMVEAGVFSKEMVQEEPISSALNRTEVVDTPEEVNLRGHMFKSIINWPAMITFVAIGAALGATFGGLVIPAGVLGTIGPAATTATTALVGALVGGGLASTFGLNMPVITNHFNNFFDKIFSGEMFGKEKKPTIQVPTPVLDESILVKPPTAREQIIVEHAAMLEKEKPHTSFQDRLALEKASPVIGQHIH